MTRLLAALPGMVRALIWVLALDLAGVTLSRNGAGGAFVLLSLASNLVAFWGGLEAINWILHRSPWVRLVQLLSRGSEEPSTLREDSTEAERWVALFRNLPLQDRPELRRGLLRLLSGAGLVFLAMSLVHFGLPEHASGPAGCLLDLFLFERLRLAPLVLASALMVPLLVLFLGREDPPRGSEWYHVALAGSLSVVAALLLYPDFGSPPPGRYLEKLLETALDPSGVFHGLMVGGVFWWLVGLAGPPQGPSLVRTDWSLGNDKPGPSPRAS
jgi:hypothetical protein